MSGTRFYAIDANDDVDVSSTAIAAIPSTAIAAIPAASSSSSSSSSSFKVHDEMMNDYIPQMETNELIADTDPCRKTSVSSSGMSNVVLITFVLICAFGFMHQMKPSEAFLTPFLRDVKGFDVHVINNKIYTVLTYSYLAFIVLLAPMAELFGYKSIVLLGALAQFATRLILLFSTSLQGMQIMQITYGLSQAAVPAYSSYLFRVVPSSHFQRAASFSSAASLCGMVVAGLMGQLLYTYAHINLTVLFYISLGTVSIAVLIAIILPPPRITQSSHDGGDDNDDYYNMDSQERPIEGFSGWMRQLCMFDFPGSAARSDNCLFIFSTMGLRQLMSDLFNAYRDMRMVRWSLWWICFSISLDNVRNYGSSIWVERSSSKYYNGYISAASQLASFSMALVPILLSERVLQRGELLLIFGGIINTILCFVQASTMHLWAAALSYVLFESISYFVLALCASRVALRIPVGRYALVFGTNTFISVFVQFIFQLILGELNLSTSRRFLVYTGFQGFVSLLLVIVVLILWLPFFQRKNQSFGKII